MSIELILAMVIATNVFMWIRIYMLKRSIDATDMMVHALMRESAPQLYADYKRWERQHGEQ